MRTTLDLPEDLIAEAMKLTKIATKTGLIKTALGTDTKQTLQVYRDAGRMV
jgi:Arc/MetJ family transcription regulator